MIAKATRKQQWWPHQGRIHVPGKDSWGQNLKQCLFRSQTEEKLVARPGLNGESGITEIGKDSFRKEEGSIALTLTERLRKLAQEKL